MAATKSFESPELAGPYRSGAGPTKVESVELALVWAGEIVELAHVEIATVTANALERAGWPPHAASVAVAAARAVEGERVELPAGEGAIVVARPSVAAAPPPRRWLDRGACLSSVLVALVHVAFVIVARLHPAPAAGLRTWDDVDADVELARHLAGTNDVVPARHDVRILPSPPPWLSPHGPLPTWLTGSSCSCDPIVLDVHLFPVCSACRAVLWLPPAFSERAARVHVGSTTARGALSPERVSRVVRRHGSEARLCYERSLARRPELAGAMTVAFDVSGLGAVSGATIVRSTIDDEDVSTCIRAAVDRWTFPASAAGTTRVSVPITFSPRQ